MLSFIDNFVGVHLSPVNDTNFTLCKRCIDSIEFCIAFRECCRTHHEAVRDTRHFNQVLDHLHTFLNESVLDDVTTPVTAIETASLNHERNDVPPEDAVLERLQQPPTVLIADQPTTPAVECARQKRRREECSGVHSTVHSKKVLKQSEERSQGKGVHIRALMRRASAKCRQEIISEVPPDAGLETTLPAVPSEALVTGDTCETVDSSAAVDPSVCAERLVTDEPPVTVEPPVSPEQPVTAEPSATIQLDVTTKPVVSIEPDVTIVSPVSSDLSAESPIGRTVEPIVTTKRSLTALNGILDAPQSTGTIVNTALRKKPTSCKPCFVAIKKLDISFFTRSQST